MTPRTAHLLILSLVCLGPAGFGVFFTLKGEQSHSDLAPLATALGLALIGASVLYAGLSTALVWKLGATPARVVGVHAAIFGVAALLFVASRIRLIVS